MARGGAPGRAVRAGLIGGVAVVFLATVGMLEKFDSRNLVGDIITLAGVMMALPPFLAAWVVVRPRVAGGGVRSVSRQVGAGLGALTGAAAGLVVVAGLVLVQILGVDAVRSVFIAVSPALIDILTFGLPLGAAAAVWLAGGAVVGAIGATLRLTSPPYRRSILAALIVTLLAALLQRVIPTALFELGLDTTWLYSRAHGGLTLIGAVVVFAVSLAAAWWWVRRGDDVRRRIGEVSRGGRSRARGVLFLAVVGVLILMPLVLGSVLTEILGTVAIFALMGLGLNIVVGYAGLLDLGYVAFFAVGAYAMALFTGAHLVTSLGETADPAFVLHLSFYQALPLVIGITALIGALIGAPVLRLRGDYLAIVTLGFGEIARVLITSDWLKAYLGGAQGLRDITDASLFGVSFREVQPFYYLALAIVLIAVYVSWRLSRSRVGRAWTAMREDEQVAEAMGVSTIKFKLLAFAIGAAIGSLSGALFAVKIGSLSPISFGVLVSITALAIVILGGLGSIPGVLVGALVLIGLPALLTEFEEYRLLLYGAVLMGIMILRPAGLIPNVRRSRELQEEERSQDEWLKETGAVDVTNVGIAVGSTVEEER